MNAAKRLSLTVWRSLTSTRLTVLLLAALLVALVIESLFPQSPPVSAVRALWLQVLAAGLLLNLVACTAQRLPRLWRVLAKPPTTARPEEFYRSHVLRQEWPESSLEERLEAFKLALRISPCLSRLYTEYDESAKCAYLYAVRGRWSQAGTLVSHAATAVHVVAVVACGCGVATMSG